MLAGPFGLLVADQGAVQKRSWVAKNDGCPFGLLVADKMGFPLPPNWGWGMAPHMDSPYSRVSLFGIPRPGGGLVAALRPNLSVIGLV